MVSAWDMKFALGLKLADGVPAREQSCLGKIWIQPEIQESSYMPLSPSHPMPRLSRGPADFAQSTSYICSLCRPSTPVQVLDIPELHWAGDSALASRPSAWPPIYFLNYKVSVNPIMRHPDENLSVAVQSHLGAGQMPSLVYKAAYVRSPTCLFLAPSLPAAMFSVPLTQVHA